MAKTEKLNPLYEKFKKDELKFELIKNENLVCEDCVNRFDDTNMPCNTSKCAIYKIKPTKVLNGGDCDEYEHKK